MAAVASSHRDPCLRALDMGAIDGSSEPSPSAASIPYAPSLGTSLCSDATDLDPCTPNIPLRRRKSHDAPSSPRAAARSADNFSPLILTRRPRAATQPAMTRRSLKDMKLAQLLLPLAPETPATPASPAAKSGGAKAWRPRCLRKAMPPPPTETVKFTPSGKVFTSYEEYADATSEIRKKIMCEGSKVRDQIAPCNTVRQAPMVLMKQKTTCFEFES
eukprot:TRINITY_DN2592_c0_g1_i1.p2 TRINITY_DN2592_c0_g1~~TRINITY_DN2592_c0_g1_i1.p2  ORF type:complete len:217 (+),score=72.23 TRINITY_DN2592_c0_g1_i1:140-790(+)